MKKIDHSEARRKVNQAIGSMAIEGVPTSRKVKADMLRIATGKVSARVVKSKLIEKYMVS